MPVTLYHKHNSFAQIRYRAPSDQDVLERVRQLHAALAGMDLAPDVKRVLNCACEEALTPQAQRPGPWFSLQPYVMEEIARLEDMELPRYLCYRYRYEIYPQRKILDGFPPCLQIEPTSVCNYRCVFCYQTDAAFTKKSNGHMGFMPLSLFKQVIDQAEGRCEAITLASRGEPLLCPEIIPMLAYLRGKFLAVKLNTNASVLDEAKCHALLEADLGVVVFSADAAEEPAYGRLRVGGRLDRIVENITQFRDIRAKQYPRSRTIIRVSGVQVPGASSLDAMERRWKELVDQVAFVKYNPWENTYEQPLNTLATPCSDLWRRTFIWWDGAVNPCDVDYRSTLRVGRADRELVGDIWQGASYTALRTAHLAQRRCDRSPCNRCTVV